MPLQKEVTHVKNKIGLSVVLLVVVFLAGFLPSYVKAHRLENELREARRESALAQLRDLASLAYFQASQKDYGLAAGTCTRYFDRTREAVNQAPDASVKKQLEGLLSLRDSITAGLAKGDPAVLHDLEALFARTREATASPSVAQRPE
jgi:hypothetical protein